MLQFTKEVDEFLGRIKVRNPEKQKHLSNAVSIDIKNMAPPSTYHIFDIGSVKTKTSCW